MSKEASDEQFFNLLKKKDSSLASQLEKIKKRGLDDWIYLLSVDKGSHTGYPHLQNVERIADKIVPDYLKSGFNAGELFLLLSTIFLHDIGKVIKPKKGHNKKEHYEKSEEIINKLGVSLGLPDERMVQYCGLISFCHGLDEPPYRSNFRDTSLYPYGKMRIPLLAAIIRIADETDHLWTRAVRNYWFDCLKAESCNLGKAFRRHIEDIEFSHEGECLIIHVAELVDADENQSPEGSIDIKERNIKRINRARKEMKEVIIGGWGKLLKKYGICFEEVYIEYENRLYIKLPKNLNPPPLSEVIEERKNLESSLKILFNAIKKLFQGTYGYNSFTWHTIEAQIGRPLTNPEKWLTRKMGNAVDDFHVFINPGEENLRIKIDNDKDIYEIEKMILGEKDQKHAK